MTALIQAVRGMNDILPDETPLWLHAETVFRRVLQGYGYQQIRFPLLEKTELFKRSIGDTTDIVTKEMYTFLDRNQDSLTLRPEGTASCVRACLEHGLLRHNHIQRLWYRGPFFRYERPQKGRFRQFHQCSAEVFGLPGPDIDADLISLSATILEKLGIYSAVKLRLHSLGNPESRKKYKNKLIKYLESNHDKLDEESRHRLHKNPLRILDSTHPDLKRLIENAPKLLDDLDEESRVHFDTLKAYLTHAGIPFEIDPFLVRGLDYYTKTVFEWTTDHLGAQGTVCGGGRYDLLVAQLGGDPTPAIGFSFGLERTLLLMQDYAPKTKLAATELHAYIITDSQATFEQGLKLSHYLRNKVHGLHIILHCGGGTIKNQFKKADKSGARYAIIIGEHELKTHSVTLKNLREETPQQTLFQDELSEYLKLKIAKRTST